MAARTEEEKFAEFCRCEDLAVAFDPHATIGLYRLVRNVRDEAFEEGHQRAIKSVLEVLTEYRRMEKGTPYTLNKLLAVIEKEGFGK